MINVIYNGFNKENIRIRRYKIFLYLRILAL